MSHLSCWIGRTEPWSDATSEKPNGDAPAQILILFVSPTSHFFGYYLLSNGGLYHRIPMRGFIIGHYGTHPLLGCHPTCLLLTFEKMSRSDFMIT